MSLKVQLRFNENLSFIKNENNFIIFSVIYYNKFKHIIMIK